MSSAFHCGTVAIIGRPNVGKSTLLNQLIGQKISITSRKVQTTRHRIAGVVTDEETQYIFVDTPGFQTAHNNALNRLLTRAIHQAIADTDVVILVCEALHFNEMDRAVLKRVPATIPVILAVNKMDRVNQAERMLSFLDAVQKEHDFRAIVPISAKSGKQLEVLKAEVATCLPIAPPIFDADDMTDRSERFLTAEFIREKIFRLVGDELPYSTSVEIEKFEQEGQLRRIFAAIIVDKPGQKAILIGAKGEKLKEIGTQARQDMEKMFGGKVYLELWVRVKKGWADDEKLLRQYGYE